MSEPLTPEDQHDYIATLPLRAIVLIAEIEANGPIVGMQSIEPPGAASDNNGHVADISTFVAAAHRGVGVGTRLMQTLCAEARNRGFRKLMATIRADNTAAQGFYARSGFKIVGVLKGHTRYRGQLIDQVLSERLLVAGDA